LESAKEAVEEFKKEYQQNIEDIRRQEREKGIFRRKKLPGYHKLHLDHNSRNT